MYEIKFWNINYTIIIKLNSTYTIVIALNYTYTIIININCTCTIIKASKIDLLVFSVIVSE